MANRWVLGLVGVLALSALIGVGYSAFTANATVNGTATAAHVGLNVNPSYSSNCQYIGQGPAPGSIVSSVNAVHTVVNLAISNLVPGAVCSTTVTVVNIGSVPLVLNDQLNETGGICAGPALNCYDVSDSSGLASATPIVVVNSITTLPVSGSYLDTINVYIPAGSVSAPATGLFSIYFTGVAGI